MAAPNLNQKYIDDLIEIGKSLANAEDKLKRAEVHADQSPNNDAVKALAVKAKDTVDKLRIEYGVKFNEARAAGIGREVLIAAVDSAIASDNNTDVQIIKEVFRKELIDLSPKYTKAMIPKEDRVFISSHAEGKLMQLYRCLSVNISQELFYLTYRAIPDDSKMQAAVIYDIKEGQKDLKSIPPVFLKGTDESAKAPIASISGGISTIDYGSISLNPINYTDYIVYNNVQIDSPKIHPDIKNCVKDEYTIKDKPSTIPLFFVFITPGGHATLMIYIPRSNTGLPKLFSLGLGFDGAGSGNPLGSVIPVSQGVIPGSQSLTGTAQLYSPDFIVKPERGNYKLIDIGFLKQKHLHRINEFLETTNNRVNLALRNDAKIDKGLRIRLASEKEVLIKDNVVNSLKSYIQNGYLDTFLDIPPKGAAAQKGGEKQDTKKQGFHYFYSGIILNKTYSYVSAGVRLTKDYVNCTSFLNYIFSDRITCGIRQTGGLVADPLQCIGYSLINFNDTVKKAYSAAEAKTGRSVSNFFKRQPSSDPDFRGVYKKQINDIFVSVFMSIYLEKHDTRGYIEELFEFLNYENPPSTITRLGKCIGDLCTPATALAAAAGAVALAAHLSKGGTRRASHIKNRRSTRRRT